MYRPGTTHRHLCALGHWMRSDTSQGGSDMATKPEPSMLDEMIQMAWDMLAIVGIVVTIFFTLGYAWGYFA